MKNLEKWTGEEKLVFGVDIGTTQSAVSFLWLQPGKLPHIEQVSKWPSQINQQAKHKTPTLIYYDRTGQPRSYGAETLTPEIEERAAREGWVLVHSFKRYVHRLGSIVSKDIVDTKVDLPPLPGSVTINLVYTHWLRYLFEHTREAFIEKHQQAVWDRLWVDLSLVITVPNGWYAQEHNFLNRAAMDAGIITDASRTLFVPETEAAVHWAVFDGRLELNAGLDFIVCDSGGSTTDIALYNVRTEEPLQLQEKPGFPSKCIEAGSTLIDYSFEDMAGQMITRKLGKDKAVELGADFRDEIIKEKHEFDASKETYALETDILPEGQLEVPRDDIAKHFDREIEKIINGIEELKANDDIKYILLLGDFGYSPYFQDKLKDKYGDRVLITQAGKKSIIAATSGGLLWFLHRGVVARASRFAFGLEILVKYNPNDPEHAQRRVIQREDGDYVAHGWDMAVPRGELLDNSHEHRRSYYRLYHDQNAQLSDFTTSVYIAEGAVASTHWIHDREGNIMPGFKEVCKVKADISGLQGKLPMATGPRGPYWHLNFQIAISFGTTSPTARMIWNVDGKEHNSPATIIPAEFV